MKQQKSANSIFTGSINHLKRSGNGTNFTGILSVGSSNDMPVSHFTATDKAPLYGVAYYRLKITDLTGVITCSKILSVSDMSGRVLSKQNIGNVIAGQPVRIAAVDHKPGKGMYIITLSGSDAAVATGKIIVQ